MAARRVGVKSGTAVAGILWQTTANWRMSAGASMIGLLENENLCRTLSSVSSSAPSSGVPRAQLLGDSEYDAQMIKGFPEERHLVLMLPFFVLFEHQA